MFGSSIDQTDDLAAGGGLLVKIAQQSEFPAYVRAEAADRCVGGQAVPDRQYADPRQRRFPCHTKAATWLSYRFFLELEKSAGYAESERRAIESRLRGFADFWELEPPVRPPAKAAAAPDDLPLRSPAELRAAVAWLTKWAAELEPERRQRAARAILEKIGADEFADRPAVETAAGLGLPDGRVLADDLRNRAFLVKPARDRASLLELAGHCGRLSPIELVKRASAIERAVRGIDRQYDLRRYYGQGLTAPHQLLHGQTRTKIAQATATHVQIDQQWYEKSALARLPVEDFDRLFGPEFVTGVIDPFRGIDPCKLAQEVQALPAADRGQALRVLADRGVRPVGPAKRASDAPDLSDLYVSSF